MAPQEVQSDAQWDTLYIDGEWREATGGETLSVENPATREQFAEVPAATVDDVDAAYEAADSAQDDWAALDRAERLEYVEAMLGLVQEKYADIVELLVQESGSSQNKAAAEVGITLADFETAIDVEPPEAQERESAFHSDKTHHIVQEPVGVVSVISPWNYPLHLTTRAVAPALALGDTVVVKPAPDTPVTGGLLLAKIADEAGLPDGVLNVVTGHDDEIGDHVSSHETPRVLSFTGSTAVGKHVAGNAGESLTGVTLELGGNGPFVVTEDVDVEQAAKMGAVGSFTHQGQVCISINRHLVHEAVYDEYIEHLVEFAESLSVGNPADPGNDLGPLINESQREKMGRFVEETIEQGATLETGGDGDGLFFQPTVLSGATNEMTAACNEHFGPVAPVVEISSDEEAIELANDTDYGLAAAVACEDEDRAYGLATQIDAGMVHVNDHPIQDEPNAPFGGVKNSGLGRYNGEWVVEKLVEPKWISVQEDERDYDLL
jgi:aldehyde dehydrogenase (NAD+)